MKTITKENAETKSEISALIFNYKNSDFRVFTSLVEEMLDKYASQFQQEWIPVEVRLPEDGSEVHTTIKINNEDSLVVTSFINPVTKRWAHNHGYVVAWQPIIIPKPYNPKQS